MATYKQKQAFKKLVDFGGCITKAMVAAGYSKATAKTPKKLTESNCWKELTGQYGHDFEFDQEKLATKLSELLEAKTLTHLTVPYTKTDQEVDWNFEVPDYQVVYVVKNAKSAKIYFSKPDARTQLKAVVLGLKLHGLLGNGSKGRLAEHQINQEEAEAIARVRKILPDSEL